MRRPCCDYNGRSRLAKAGREASCQPLSIPRCYPAPPARAFDLFRRPAERVRSGAAGTAPSTGGRAGRIATGVASDGARPALGRDAAHGQRDHGVRGRRIDRGGAAAGAVPVVEAHATVCAAPDGGVRITDVIEYEPPGGVLGRLATAEVIGRELERIFAYRRERLTELLARRRPAP